MANVGEGLGAQRIAACAKAKTPQPLIPHVPIGCNRGKAGTQ